MKLSVVKHRLFAFAITAIFLLFAACTVINNTGTDGGSGDPAAPDTVSPVVTITSHVNGQLVGETYTLAGIVSDNKQVDRVFIRVDANPFFEAARTGGFWSSNITVSAPGDHTNYVYAMDASSNVSVMQTVIVTYVFGTPSITIMNPVHFFITNKQSVNVSGTVSVTSPLYITQVELSLNGGVFTGVGNTNWNTNGLLLAANQTNDIQARAIANNGVTNASTVIKVIVDTNRPAISVTSHTNNQPVTNYYSLSGSVSDNFGVSNVYARLGTNSFRSVTTTAGAWSTNLNISAGIHTNQVFAIDLAGNYSTTNTVILTFIDTNRPVVTILSHTNNQLVSNNYNLTGIATDNIAVSNVYVKAGTNSFQSASFSDSNWSYLVQIDYGFQTNWVYAVDWIGNFSSTNMVVVSLYDAMSPTISINSHTNGQFAQTNYTFSGSAWDDTGLSIFFKLDDGLFSPITPVWDMLHLNCTWSTNLNVTPGIHTNHVYAVDWAGKHSSTNMRIIQNTNLFLVTIDYPINNWTTNSNEIMVYGTATTGDPEFIGTVELSVNGGIFNIVDAISNTTWYDYFVYLNLFNATNTLQARSISSNGQTNLSEIVNVIHAW